MSDESTTKTSPGGEGRDRLFRGYGPLVGFMAVFLAIAVLVPSQQREVRVEALDATELARSGQGAEGGDLATEEGARTLYARLAAAAERACGSAPRTLALTEHMRYRACYDSTLTRAVEKIGSQQVHALHAARTDSSVG